MLSQWYFWEESINKVKLKQAQAKATFHLSYVSKASIFAVCFEHNLHLKPVIRATWQVDYSCLVIVTSNAFSKICVSNTTLTLTDLVGNINKQFLSQQYISFVFNKTCTVAASRPVFITAVWHASVTAECLYC